MSRVRATLVLAVTACVAPLPMTADPALAQDATPTLSASALTCRPENAQPPGAGSTRPGDYVFCQLRAAVLGGNVDHVTAVVTVPATTAYAPLPNAEGVGVPTGAPTTVTFDETRLGLINPGIAKAVGVRLRVLDGAATAAPIDPVATLSAPGVASFTTAAPPLTVMPLVADLTASTAACANADATATAVRPGDTVECRFSLRNAAGREDAAGVTLAASLPISTALAPGGNVVAHVGRIVAWSGAALPTGVLAGATADPLIVRFTIDPAVLGGAAMLVSGTVTWTNALSGAPGIMPIAAPALLISPGPAVLAASGLSCADLNGPPLLEADLVECTLALRSAPGHEDVADVSASAAVPDLTSAVAGAGADGRLPLLAPPTALAAGAVRTVAYRLRVAAGAGAGTVIVPTALVAGRSVPSGTPVGLSLAAAPLVVGNRDAPATTGAAPRTPAGALAAATGAAARGPVICGSRRVVTVNVRPPRGQHWKAVTFAFAKRSVAGHKATGAKGKKGYFRGRLVIQGLPRGPLKVAIKGVTRRGRTVHSTRTYNLCTKRQ